jgi:hypothetical protein
MDKIQKLLSDVIDSNNWMETEFKGLHTFENSKSFTEVNADIVSQELARVTKEIAFKFVEFCGDGYQKFWDKWIKLSGDGQFENPYTTTQDFFTMEELFDEFLKTL